MTHQHSIDDDKTHGNQWKLCVIIPLAVVIAWYLWIVICWDGSLTTQRMTVFVNGLDHVDGAKCVWSGSQFFDITTDGVTARFRVIASKADRIMTALIDAREAERLVTESIVIRLIERKANGDEHDVLRTGATSLRAPLLEHSDDGRVRSWFQEFRIAEDFTKAPDGSIRLLWSMDYRDAAGEIKHLSVSVPLRKEEITVRSSIVTNGEWGNQRDQESDKGTGPLLKVEHQKPPKRFRTVIRA